MIWPCTPDPLAALASEDPPLTQLQTAFLLEIKKLGRTSWIGAFCEHGNPPHSRLSKVEGCARDKSRDPVVYVVISRGMLASSSSRKAFLICLYSLRVEISMTLITNSRPRIRATAC
jgi:hypothetical protein